MICLTAGLEQFFYCTCHKSTYAKAIFIMYLNTLLLVEIRFLEYLRCHSPVARTRSVFSQREQEVDNEGYGRET